LFEDARNIEELKERERAARRDLRAKEKAAEEAEQRYREIAQAEMQELLAYARRKKHTWPKGLRAWPQGFRAQGEDQIDYLVRWLGYGFHSKSPEAIAADEAREQLSELSRRVRRAKKDIETYPYLRESD
jgi:hypothetical protein